MGEKDTDTTKQIEMPGFEAPKLPQHTPYQYKETPTPSLESSKKTPLSVSKLIDLIELKPNHTKDIHEPKPYKVKMIDRNTWINVRNKEEGQAISFFLYLTEEQNLNVKEVEILSSHLFSSGQDKRGATLEEVGACLRFQQVDKPLKRDFSYEDIQKMIDYCQDKKNNIDIIAMVSNDRGVKLPSHYHD